MLDAEGYMGWRGVNYESSVSRRLQGFGTMEEWEAQRRFYGM